MRFKDLLDELRRRHVVRVAVVYAAVAWVVVEVSDTVFPNLALPSWTVTLVTVLAVRGVDPPRYGLRDATRISAVRRAGSTTRIR